MKSTSQHDTVLSVTTAFFPKEGEINVPVDSCISITFSECITDININQLFKVKQVTSIKFYQFTSDEDVCIQGFTTWNPQTRVVTFIPAKCHLFTPNSTYSVELNLNAIRTCSVPRELLLLPPKWSFSTAKLDSIRVVIVTDGKRKLITLQRNGSLFSELIAQISSKLHCQVHAVGSIHYNNIPILTEKDILTLTDTCEIHVTLLNEDQQKHVSVVVHDDVPELTYKEYVEKHYAPSWAGFYVFGNDKYGVEEEMMIITALLNAAENQDNL